MDTRTFMRTTFFNSNADADKFDAFNAGWEACLMSLERERALKQKRKNKALILEDFLGSDKTLAFNEGFYCDGGFKVATDARVLVKVKADYPAENEGKIIGSNGEVIDGQYPNYNRVIPTEGMGNNLQPSSLTLEDFCIIRSTTKVKSATKLYDLVVNIGDTVKFAMYTVDRVIKFWEAYPDAELYSNDDMKPWLLRSGDNLMVFMPNCKENPDFYYSIEDKIATVIAA